MNGGSFGAGSRGLKKAEALVGLLITMEMNARCK